MCNIDSYRIPVRNSPIFPPCITVKLAFMQQTTEEISLQVSVTNQQTEAGKRYVLNESGKETLIMTFFFYSSLVCNTLTF